ncbi:hypothetical protein [uncultured Duncaniella sp.]|uniref:hypothetical protein n=1 Tax=uncultured Duncaniella sp. TaxID=2768039 RepID=UPI00261C82E8|nr:hypothetical protein [uncultured Duncaniella sp.]
MTATFLFPDHDQTEFDFDSLIKAIGLHICFFEMELPKILPRQKKSRQHRRPVSAASI